MRVFAGPPDARSRAETVLRGFLGDSTPRTERGGSFCLSVSTGSKRSPNSATRLRAASESKASSCGSFLLKHFFTSSQVTGVETIGRSFARSEYTQTVVL